MVFGKTQDPKTTKRGREAPFTWANKADTLTDEAKHIIFGMHLMGGTNSHIGSKFNIDPRTVSRVVERFVDGVYTADDNRWSISPEKTLVRRHLVAVDTIAEVVRRLDDDFDIEVSRRTVQRDLAAQGIFSYSIKRTSGLTDDRKLKRLAEADYLESHPSRELAFSDECLFICNSNQKSFLCRRGAPQKTKPKSRWTATCHVWGVIAHGYAKLVFLDKARVNEDHYMDTLFRFYVNDPEVQDLVFMQAGAPAHRSARTTCDSARL